MILLNDENKVGFWTNRNYYWFWAQNGEKRTYKFSGILGEGISGRKSTAKESKILSDYNLTVWES